jgi:preprotein translocase subunit YajC
MIDALLAMGAGGQAGAGSQGGGGVTLLMMGSIFVIFYFLLIRPQQKRQKEHQAMVAALKKGDKIASTGGLIGVITGVSDDAITMEIAPKVRVKITRGSVAGKLS